MKPITHVLLETLWYMHTWDQRQLASMYTHHNSVLSWLLWDSLATLLFLTESRAHASANSDLITNLTTQQVSVNPGLSHLLTVIVVQVSISMQTEPLPLPLLEWNKHTVIIKLFLLYTNQSHSHTNSRRQNLHICLAVHVPARLSVTCTTVHNASNENLDGGLGTIFCWILPHT